MSLTIVKIGQRIKNDIKWSITKKDAEKLSDAWISNLTSAFSLNLAHIFYSS